MFDECLYFNTTCLARQLEREWTVAFKPFDLTPPQAFMLRLILDHPGLLPHQIADDLAISRPTATRLLDGLESKQLVERRAAQEDGRELQIFPTPKGKARKLALEAASRATARRVRRMVGGEFIDETVEHLRATRDALQ